MDILGNRYIGLTFCSFVKSLKIHKNYITINDNNMNKISFHKHLLLFINKVRKGDEDAVTDDNDTF